MGVRSGYKLTEAGVVPDEWEVRRLGELASVSAGGTPSRANTQFWDGDIPWVTTSEVDFYTIMKSEQFITKEGLAKSPAKLLPPGTLLMALYGQGKTRGKIGILGIEAATNQACATISLSRSVSTDFIFHSLTSQYETIRKLSNTGNQENLNGSLVRSILIPLPSFLEQLSIAEALSNMDALLGALDRLIAKKRDLKQAAMQQLLTGQTRLPGFCGEWMVKRLGEVAAFHKGKGLPKSAISVAGATPCIHYGELFTRYGEIIFEVISRTDVVSPHFLSEKNDVLMPTSDVTPRGLAKASCVEINDVILGGDILVIRSDKNLIFGPFLSYLIRYEEEQVLQLVTGSTVFHLYGTDMKKFNFSMPSFSEQTAIAEILSAMDAELSALEQRRNKTRDLKQAMMQELLTGRIRLV